MAVIVFCPTCSRKWNATNIVERDKYDAEYVEEVRCRDCGGKTE